MTKFMFKPTSIARPGAGLSHMERWLCSLSPFLPLGRSRPSATGYGEGRGEGSLRGSIPCGEPPHPDLLPAGGEKEKKTVAPYAMALPKTGREKIEAASGRCA